MADPKEKEKTKEEEKETSTTKVRKQLTRPQSSLGLRRKRESTGKKN